MTAAVDRPDAVLITPAMPSDGGNGLAMRAGLLHAGLARSCDVTVQVAPAFGVPGDPAADMIGRLQLPGGVERAQALHPLPSLARTASADAARQTAELAAGAALVLVLREYLLPLLDVLLAQPRRPRLVLDVDDVESVTQRQLGERAEAERFARLEAHYLPLMDAVTTCSREDATLLGATTVIPNAIRMPTLDGAARDPDHDLLFVGNLSYAPNVEAARWLCHEMVPLLGDDVRVAIVGSRPTADVHALATDARVTLAPDVPDVTPWYARSSVAVVPVRRGGGSRIKLIEALAHRRPVVSTTVGAAGMPWSVAESPVVVADTTEAFARACRELLGDPARARDLGARGSALVRERASIEAVAPQIDRLVRSMVRP